MKKVIFLSLIILFSIKTQNIYADQSMFTVDNIEVTDKYTADNIIKREKYLNIGFKKAFESLVTGLLRKEDHKRMLSTELKIIKSLIDNYRILEEGTQQGEYSFKLSVKFNKEKTKDFFYKKNIPYSETSTLEIILYPIMISNSELKIFSQNQLFEEWNNNKDFKEINFILPVENIEDINFIKNNQEILEEINLDRLVNNYQIKNSAILILRKEEKKINIFLKTNFSGTKKNNKIEFVIDNYEEEKKRADLIRNIKSFINEVWKEENLIDISVPTSLTIMAAIDNPKTLSIITSKLDNINFIENYKIEEISMNFAKIKISYFGKIKNIRNSFKRNGFKFEIINDQWFLSLAN